MSKRIIFENEFVEALVISWKRNRDFNTYKRICAESINLIDSIIRGSKFNLQVPFLDLRNWLFLQFERWISKWIPGEGKLYTYMCLAGETRILLEDGRKVPIREIVENKLPVRVMSLNRETGELVAKPVTNWFITPSSGKSEWMQLVCEKAGTQAVSVYATREHRFPTNLGEVRCEDLRNGVHELYVRRDRLTKLGEQVVLGTYMGDASVSEGGLLQVSHGVKQRKYSEFLAGKFGAKVAERRCDYKGGFSKPGSKAYGFTTHLNRIWGENEHGLPSKKVITRELLDRLEAPALAVWFMDDGYCVKYKNGRPKVVGLCTNGFSQAESDIIIQWFLDRHDIRFNKPKRKVSKKDDIRCWRQADMARFLAIVAPNVIPLLQYKLPNQYRGSSTPLSGEFLSQVMELTANWHTAPAKRARRMGRVNGRNVETHISLKNRYCIEVADTHTFIAEGVASVNSVSIKHGCMSYCTKEKLLKQRYVYTDVPLESLSDAVAYSENFGFDTGDRMRAQLADIVIRWHEPQVREAIKYMMYAVLRNRGVSRRKFVLKTACEAYSIDMDTAKFMLDWTHGAVRHAFLEHYDQPLTYQDLLCASAKFSFVRDLMNVVGYDLTKRLCCVFAGASIKFPPASQLVKFARVASAVKNPSDEAVLKRNGFDHEQLYATIEGILGAAGDGILEERPLYSDVHEVPALQ